MGAQLLAVPAFTAASPSWAEFIAQRRVFRCVIASAKLVRSIGLIGMQLALFRYSGDQVSTGGVPR